MPDPVHPSPGSAPLELHLDSPSPSAARGGTPAGDRFADVLAASEGEQERRGWIEALRDSGGSIARGERLLDRAVRAGRRGIDLGHAELLALQAGVYRYTQELELASKLVDKTTSAVRHVVQSQH